MKSIELVSSFSPRGYQQALFANTMNKNSLIVLPTGLGKTIIALMHSIYHYNKNNKKILFLAPTKPLVQQHEQSFKELIANKDSFIFQTLTGTTSPSKRKQLYHDSDFIFSTPQLIENDIINSRINLNEFSLIIIDEAHRATGNYAYCFIAEQFSHNAQILALTASPGTDKEEIEEIMHNLQLNQIEVKSYEDEDVKPHVQKTQIEHIEVHLNEEQKTIKQLFNKVVKKKIEQLHKLNITTLSKTPSKKEILDLQSELKKQIGTHNTDDTTWRAISLAAALMKLYYGIELFESQDFHASYLYFYNFYRQSGDRSKAAAELSTDIDFTNAFEALIKINKKNQQHPKLIKLKELLQQEFTNTPDIKIIIFSQYRETANHLVEELKNQPQLNPVLFIGQNKKGNIGMSQKQQKTILEEFRNGTHNILISTSVGEEGLDIPKVDTVIFYEPVPSAIRTIQRIGRTGRFSQGKAFVLQTKDTKDIAIRYVASAKEKKMYTALRAIKGELGEKKQKGLNEYFSKENNSTNNENSKINDSSPNRPLNSHNSNDNTYTDSTPKILVDSRENSDLIKKLFHIDEFTTQATHLTSGDIVISQDIAIERKAVNDFVSSILDKRLFPQLIELAKNFKRPILLIEGEESLYAQRNVNPNVIRATLSSIATELRMPIIYSSSIEESVEFIKTIVKRQNKDKNALSLVSQKKSLDETQELEKFVSSIPKVNAVTAKQLLQHFNTIEDIVKATQKQLEEVEGIGSIRAKYIYEFFKREYNNK